MLKARVFTAIALLAVLIPGLFHFSQTGWAVLMALFIGVGAWEWGRLMRLGNASAYLLGALFLLAALLFTFFMPSSIGAGGIGELPAWMIVVHGVSVAFWGGLVPVWLKRRFALPGGFLGVLAGLVVLFPTWFAVVQLRSAGPLVLLGILAIVWIADIAAYFSGKTFGRHKLAPAISPGKTWEGAAGAVVGVLIYGFAVKPAGSELEMNGLFWALALVGITAVSIMGDLFESMLKRQAGIKDSSHVLPGHGGVLDRIDSLTSTLPLVAFFWLLLARGF